MHRHIDNVNITSHTKSGVLMTPAVENVIASVIGLVRF